MASSVSSSASGQVCAHCLEDGVTLEGYSYCYNCESVFCVSCDKLHRKFASDHRITLAIDKRTDYVDQTFVSCKIHPQQTLDQFCQDDEMVLCNVCKTIKHRKCHVVSLMDALPNEDICKSLDELSSKLSALQETAKTAKCDKQSVLEQTKTKRGDLKDNIDYLRDGLNKVLNGYEKQLIIKQNQFTNALTTTITSFDTLKTQTETEMKTMEKAKGNRTLETVSLINAKSLYKEYKCFVEEVGNDKTDFDIHITEDETLPSLIQQLKNIVHRDIVDSEEITEGATNDPSINKSFLNVSSCSLVKETDIRLPYDAKVPYISGFCFSSGGDIILCDFENMKVKLADKDSMTVKFSIGCSKPPFDVDRINDSSAVATVPESRSLLFIKTKPGLKLQGLKVIDFAGYGVAVYNQTIYVCGNASCGIKKGVKVLSPQGEAISFIAHTGSGIPHYICLSDDASNVCFTAGSGQLSTINCLTRDGYGIFSVSDKCFKYPRSLVCDKTGNCLICDDEMKTIGIVNSVGAVCNTLVTRKDEFQPKSLYLKSSDDLLVVALWSEKCSKLAVYKLNYG